MEVSGLRCEAGWTVGGRWVVGSYNDEMAERTHRSGRVQVMEEIRILINHDKMMAHELAKASGRDGPPLPTDLIQNVYLFRGLSTAVGYIHEPAEDAPWLQLIAERGELFCLFFKGPLRLSVMSVTWL